MSLPFWRSTRVTRVLLALIAVQACALAVLLVGFPPRDRGVGVLREMFKLSRDEFEDLMFHFGTSSWGGTRKPPRAFTEQGVAMLSGVLRSKRAVRVNIEIMRAFVRLRHILAENRKLARKLDELERKYDGQFAVVFEAIRQLMKPDEPPAGARIGFHNR